MAALPAPSDRGLLAVEQRSAAYFERAERKLGRFDRPFYNWLETAAEWSGSRRRRLERFAARVESLRPDVERMSDRAIAEQVPALRRELLRAGLSDAALVRAFAAVREVSFRTIGQRHYPVQLMGGYALARGMLAEMATGEGKTITAALAAVSGALAGLPVHVVTVNDYLADRDARHLAPLYTAFGLTTGIVQHDQSVAERQAAYAADVTYSSNKEVAFDYLRDRLVLGHRRRRAELAVDRLKSDTAGSGLRLRGLGFAIVDEADSILVDEARTPLIIAGQGDPGDGTMYRAVLAAAGGLSPGRDFTLRRRDRRAELSDAGRAALDGAGLPRNGHLAVRHAREDMARMALAALHLYVRDEHYVVRDGKIEIVDEHTGRIAEGRSWEHGLHQLIEAKEGVALTAPNVTQARITYQRFFQRYAHLSGMTGTAAELAGEMRAVYDLAVVRIPLNRPSRRRALGTSIVADEPTKWQQVARSVTEAHRAGRPVLVGTRAVSASEAVSAVLAQAAIAHVVLNARQDAEEAAVVARAGEPGRVTVATNIAGRGTDIKLADGVAAAGGLHVIMTEFHESPRIDRQLIGRGGRQGDPASYEIIAAFDDEVFRKFGGLTLRVALAGAARASLSGPFADRLARLVQRRASRYFDAIRRRTLAEDLRMRQALSFAGVDD